MTTSKIRGYEQIIDNSVRVAQLSIDGDLAFGSHKITGLADGVNPQDAVTKGQLDASGGSFDGELNGVLHVYGTFSTPSDNDGLELFYWTDKSVIQSYKRTTNAFAPFELRGSEFTFLVDGTEKVNIRADGNFGIGVPNPQTPLHIAGIGGQLATFPTNLGGADALIIEANNNTAISMFTPNTSSGALKFYDPDGAFWSGIILYDHPTDTMSFGTAGMRNMYLNDSGYLGIGLDDALAPMHVKGLYGAATGLTDAGQMIVEGNTDQHAGLTIIAPTSAKAAGFMLTNRTNGNGWSVSGRNDLETPYDRLAFYTNNGGSWYQPFYLEKDGAMLNGTFNQDVATGNYFQRFYRGGTEVGNI